MLVESQNPTVNILPTKRRRARPLFDPPIVKRAIWDSVVKLNPVTMMKNPVMFVVEVGAALTTVLVLRDWRAAAPDLSFTFQITLWLWFTVLFANFAEAMAEGRGKAQADTLRKTKTETVAHRLKNGNKIEDTAASQLRQGDIVVCNPGDIIPGDGEVIEGIASVDESAITGESAPVIRESGGDRSAVTGGTKVLSDGIKIKITSNPGETFLDRMIALVEGAQRQKTPNEIALNIVIAGSDAGVPAGRGDSAAIRAIQCNGHGRGQGAQHRRVDLAVGVLDTDDDRRLAIGDRHRRHGSRNAA